MRWKQKGYDLSDFKIKDLSSTWKVKIVLKNGFLEKKIFKLFYDVLVK